MCELGTHYSYTNMKCAVFGNILQQEGPQSCFHFCPLVLTPLSGVNEGGNRKMGHERLFLCGFLHWVAHLGPLGTLFTINIACIR